LRVPWRMLSGVSVMPLEQIVHVDKLMQETPRNIKKAWMRHHHKRDCIGAVLEGLSYDKLVARTKESPMFVFPLPRDKGFQSIFFQAMGNVHLYTDLEAYKQYGEKAVPALSCAFYTELQRTKGIVLMRGELNTTQLQPTDAAFLGNQTTIWYHEDERYKNFVWTFNHKPSEFRFDGVVEYMGRL
jgi:ATP synthase mitochondrial F1 complex assembly factor 1